MMMIWRAMWRKCENYYCLPSGRNIYGGGKRKEKNRLKRSVVNWKKSEEGRGDGQIAAAAVVFVFVYQRAEENSPFFLFNSSELFSLINRWIGQQFSVCDCSGKEEEERKRKWQREERERERISCRPFYLPLFACCCLLP